MNLKETNKKGLFIFLFCLISFIAGGINGFLGTGGGIILIFMLSLLTKNEQKDNFASSLCATLLISFFSLVAYYRNEKVDFEMLKIITPFVIGGGIIGAILMDKINVKWLNIIFAILMIYSGFSMIK